MEAFREKAVGWTMVLGAVLCGLSAVLAFTFAGAGIFHATLTRNPTTGAINDMGDSVLVPPAMLAFSLGLLMIGGSIAYVLIKTKTRHAGRMRILPNARVIARYGYTKDWNMLTEEYQFAEAEDPTYFLKIETSPGVIGEYECRPETYFSAGEGMIGEAMLQGKWCGRFAPYIGIISETQEAVRTYK
jgi:hypothetical protein